MRKKFVPEDIALKLKKIGFNEDCMAYFNTEIQNFDFKFKVIQGSVNNKLTDYILATPLWQDAEDWLLRNKKIFISYYFDDNAWEVMIGKFTTPDFIPDFTFQMEEEESYKASTEALYKVREFALNKVFENYFNIELNEDNS